MRWPAILLLAASLAGGDAWRISAQLPSLAPDAPAIVRARGEALQRETALRGLVRAGWPLARVAQQPPEIEAEIVELLEEEAVQRVGLPGRLSPYRLWRRLGGLALRLDEPLLDAVILDQRRPHLWRGRHFHAIAAATIARLPASCPPWWRIELVRSLINVQQRTMDLTLDPALPPLQRRDALALLAELGSDPRILDRERLAFALPAFPHAEAAKAFAGTGDPTLVKLLAGLSERHRELVSMRCRMKELTDNPSDPDVAWTPAAAGAAVGLVPELERLAASQPSDPFPPYWALNTVKFVDPGGGMKGGVETRRDGSTMFRFGGFNDWQAHQAAVAPWIERCFAADPTFARIWPACLVWGSIEMFPAMDLLAAATRTQAWDLGIPQQARLWCGYRVLGHARGGHMWTAGPWKDAILASVRGELAWAASPVGGPERLVAARTMALAIGWFYDERSLLREALRDGPTGVSELDWPPSLICLDFASVLADAQRRLGEPAAPEPPVAAIDMQAPWQRGLDGLLREAGLADAEARQAVSDCLQWWWWERPHAVTVDRLSALIAAGDHPALRLALALLMDGDGRRKQLGDAWMGAAGAPPALRLIIGACHLRYGFAFRPRAAGGTSAEARAAAEAAADAADAVREGVITAMSATLAALLAAPPDDDQLAVLTRVLDDRHGANRHADRRLWQEGLAAPALATASPRLRLLRGMLQLNLARAVRGNDCPDFTPALPGASIPGAMSGAARRALDLAWQELPGDPTVAGAAVSAARALGLDGELTARWTGRLLATAPHPVVVHHVLLQMLSEGAGDREPNRWIEAVRLCAAADPERDLPRSAITLAEGALRTIKPNRGEWRKPEVGAALAAAGAATLARQPADADQLRHQLLGLAWVCRHAPLANDMLQQLGEPDPARIPEVCEARVPAIRSWLAEVAEKERQRAEKAKPKAKPPAPPSVPPDRPAAGGADEF